MNESRTDRMFQLAKEYRDISRQRRDIDFRLCQWARKLRDEVPNDEEFVRWCVDELGLTDGEARHDLLTRALAFSVAPDKPTWTEIGGFRAARKLATLPRKEQVACIGAMRASGYGVDKILRDRGHAATGQTRADAHSAADDAARLARFIAESVPEAPRAIKAIVERYAARAKHS